MVKFTHDKLSLADVSAKLFMVMEEKTSGDLHSRFDGELAEPQKVAQAFLGAVGLKLFFENDLKNQVPDWLGKDKFAINAYYEGAKRFYLNQELKKAEDVLLKIESQKEDVVEYDFSKTGFDFTTISIVLAFLETKGWHVNWNSLDHKFSTIHEDWVCKFTKGKKITAETLIASTVSRLATRDPDIAFTTMWEDPAMNSYGLKNKSDDGFNL